MGIAVYANGMSIACKAASGKSAAAMPDVCLSPPSPPAGPLPLPYPNTAMASDTTDGSKTVQIGGQEVMLKNKSTFKTSNGNEAATKSFGMGVVTHQIQGKAAFVAWSMDVKFEGENIPRHMDLMGHNEASDPPNVPPWLYADSQASDGSEEPCKDVQEAVKNNCTKKTFNKGSPGCPPACCEAKKCVMSPKGRVPECCDGKTKHHAVPDHCFKAPGKTGDYYPGFEKMTNSAGLCACVSGEDKNDVDTTTNQLLTHGKIHRDFDRIENQYRDGNGGKWKVGEATGAAADVVGFHTGCNKKCLKQQMTQYHKSLGIDDGKVLRADADSGSSPASTEMGDLNAGWSKRFG
jgi:hypothetical protein